MPKKQVHPGAARSRKRPPHTAVKKKTALPNRTPAERRKLAERFKGIRKCYDRGAAIRDACTNDAGASDIRQQAKHYGLPDNTARRYRQFAKVYTPADVEALQKLCERHNYAISMTHIFALICVPPKMRKLRQEMEKEAAEKKLSIGGLWQLKKAKIKTPGSAGGRKPGVVKLHDKNEVHAAINFETAKWRRWLDMLVNSKPNIEAPLKAPLKDLHTLVRKVEKLSSR